VIGCGYRLWRHHGKFGKDREVIVVERIDPLNAVFCIVVTIPSSGRVLTKLGFVEVGRAERPSLPAGLTVPSVEMRLESPAKADSSA